MDELTALLNQKIRNLSPMQLRAVERFIDLMHESDPLVCAAYSLSEPSFAAVWDSPEDDVYDSL